VKKFFNAKTIAAVAAAVLIVIISAIALSSSGRAGFVTNAAAAITKPIRVTAAAIAHEFESLYGYMYKYDSLLQENERLRTENAELQSGYREYTEIYEENERLRKLLDLTERHSDYVIDTATVISWSSSNWSSSFTISKGSSNSDVQKGDSVITETGMLVGQVTEVGNTTSTCITIIDSAFSASALVESSGDAVVAKGDFARMRKGLLTLDYISEGTMMYTGDAVTTSGKGEVFPRGLLVGYVADMTENASGLGMTADIEPAVSLGSIMNVYVITDFTVAE